MSCNIKNFKNFSDLSNNKNSLQYFKNNLYITYNTSPMVIEMQIFV